jgi:hypothetical protein
LSEFERERERERSERWRLAVLGAAGAMVWYAIVSSLDSK